MSDIKIMAGSSNTELATKIAKELSIPLVSANINRFADGEISLKIGENLRGKDIFILQSTCRTDKLSVNEHCMELFFMIGAAHLASARRITVVMPYYGYARQDRKTDGRTPISAKHMAALIESQKPHRVLCMDLHCGQIQAFFNVPVDNLVSERIFVNYFRMKNMPVGEGVVVSPDAGGAKRARMFAEHMDMGFAIIDKYRKRANEIASMQVVGDVTDKVCILIDDMIDTAGTLCKAAEALLVNGARKVYACATHGIFSGEAMERINNSPLEEVVVTDSIPQHGNVSRCPKLVVLSVAPLLAEAIRRTHNEESISSLFQF